MTTTEPAPLSAAGNPIGFGRMLRKEDARFLRGQGNYLDDIRVQGMLHGAILRSPLAHARIVSIDTSAAEAHPKVKAVITGATLETLGLAWMPTLSQDVQAVLATDKVRSRARRWRSSSPTTATRPVTRSSSSRWSTSRSTRSWTRSAPSSRAPP